MKFIKSIYQAVYAPVLIGLVALFLYLAAESLPPPRFEPMGPAFFPQWVLIGIMILCIYDFIWPVIRKARGESFSSENIQEDVQHNYPLLFSTIFLSILYILIIVYTDIPFLVISFIFMSVLGFIIAGGIRNHLVPVICTALGVVVFIELIFGLLLGVFFP